MLKDKIDKSYKSSLSGSDADSAPAPRKILIADDDPIIRAMMQRTLQNAGFDVVTAENGKKAIELLSDQISAILLDIQMPEMDGMECLRYIQKNYKDLPSIMVTASDDVSNAVDAMKYGAFDYVTKPFNPKELIALIKQAVKACEQARRLKEMEAELAKAREHEINIAARIQTTLLIGQPPQDLKGMQVAQLTIPSQKIDGDFYDFFRLNEQSLDVVVGDVMGKGIPAALLGAAMKNHFLRVLNELSCLENSKQLPNPEKIVSSVHDGMIDQMEELETFVTLCYARFDLSKNLFVFVDCGHMRTIHFHNDSSRCNLLQGENMPLGFPETEPFKQISVPFKSGDIFFFYSDGLTEAVNQDGSLYGEERLVDIVQKNARINPDSLINNVLKEIVDFSGSGTFDDDFTCVVVKID